MPVERIQEHFEASRSAKRGALLPYFTAGFPDAAFTADLIRRADALGAAVVEVGIPYSDSIADGPVIQDSFHRALEHGHTLEDTFRLVSEVRSSVACGIVAMVSFSLVHRFGVERFLDRAADAGFDGVILPDVPVEEATFSANAARKAGLAYVGLVAPTTTPERRKAIAAESSGFVYQIAVAGTTGERQAMPPSLADEVARLRETAGLPICVGFGISCAEHVRDICRVADGAIVGSAIVRRVAAALESGQPRGEALDAVSAFVAELITGLTPAHS